MATNIERVQAAAEAILGRSLSNEQLERTATRFTNHWSAEVDALLDEGQEEPTADQKAGFFLGKLAEFVQDILRIEGKKEAAETVIPDIEDSGDAAADDFAPADPVRR